ncbi:uncharacterized mitochondrial protein AtMg00810-like [Quercus suber]|uniref:uncharacterized mitochondrial protein AtMg00810-like n=1 Tax=Quercus suber TaxID=58331 RepID=UPI0032E02392
MESTFPSPEASEDKDDDNDSDDDDDDEDEDASSPIAQVYVDDIIFESTKDELAHGFSKLMQAEFKMSMIEELTHFLGLQIRQQDSDIFLSQSKYAKNLVKKFGLESASSVNLKESHMTALKRIIKYVKTTAELGVWYSKDTNDVLAGYSDADWTRNADDRKSTSGGCFYVGNNLVS